MSGNVRPPIKLGGGFKRVPKKVSDDRRRGTEGSCSNERRSKGSRKEEWGPKKRCDRGSRSRNVARVGPLQIGLGEGFERMPKKVFEEVKEEKKRCNGC